MNEGQEEFADLRRRLGDTVYSPIPSEIEDIAAKVVALTPQHPNLPRAFLKFLLSREHDRFALDFCRGPGMHSTDPFFWIEAAQIADELGDRSAVCEFCEKAFVGSDESISVARRADVLLLKHGLHDQAVSIWSRTVACAETLAARLGLVRALGKAKRDEEVLREALVAVSSFPLDLAGERDQLNVVALVRQVRRVAAGHPLRELLAEHEDVIANRNNPSTLRGWVLGVLAAVRGDKKTALEHFAESLAYPPLPASLRVDPHFEIGNIRFRHGEYADARSSFASAGSLPDNATLQGQLKTLARVVAICGASDRLLYPECLIDVIFDEVAAAPFRYDVQRASVMTVCKSFGCGGAERQAVTVLSGLAHDPRITKVTAVVRSIDGPGEDFLLPQLRQIPLEPIVYGTDWERRTPILTSNLPLAGKTRLCAAIDLLPHDLREEVVRLSSLMVKERPQAVHLRQDLYGGAIACAVAGVPNIVVHRGTMAPNLWGLDQIVVDRFVRPMRHTYRRLLQMPGFRMVNISYRCSESDREWIEWPDKTRFRAVSNGIDFESLGPATGRNLELRHSFGIGDDAFVLGGAFRLEPVKRPLLWMEVAARVADVLTDSHFLIIGDGAMREAMQRYAAARGFSDRVHMPGTVSDVGNWYRAMDVNLLTSEREGLSNVLVESQYFGVPALATDVGGTSEAIEPDVTGFLVSPDADPDRIAAMALRIWGDPAWREGARSRAPKYVREKFGPDQTINSLMACFGIGPGEDRGDIAAGIRSAGLLS